MTATGNNYAEALFMLAREQNAVEGFYEGLKIAEGIFKENPEYLQFLSAPSIPKSERTAALAAAFESKIHTDVLSFLQLLCEHGKTEQFSDCVAEFCRLREWANNTAVAVIKSAVELDESQKAELKAALERRTHKNITLKTQIDKTLLGGIVVELDGELLDGSVKNNLKRVREVIGV